MLPAGSSRTRVSVCVEHLFILETLLQLFRSVQVLFTLLSDLLVAVFTLWLP